MADFRMFWFCTLLFISSAHSSSLSLLGVGNLSLNYSVIHVLIL